MEQHDFECLLEILAEQAMSPIGVKEFFRDLINKTNLPQKWKWEVFDIWTGNPGVDAEKLIKWATGIKGDSNPEDCRFKTLGSLLHPLLPNLGIDKARLVIELIIRYDLFLDKIILIDFFIKYNKYQAVFNRDSISVLTQYVSHLIEQDANKVADDLIEKLIQILTKIRIFEVVIEAFFAIFDNPEQVNNDSDKEINILKQKYIDNFFKIFVFFYLILEKYPCPSDRIQRVINFSTFLQQKSPEISDSLKDWLNEVKDKYGYQSSYLSTSDSINQLSHAQTNDLLEAYLMVIIRPVKPLSRRKFRVNGFLKIGENFEQWIYPNYKPEELIQQDNLFTLKQAENYVAKLIYKTVDLILPQKTKLKFNDYSITIEFFLPCSYLCEQVDRWVIELGEKIPIGRDYKVAVRSYERIASQIGEGNEVEQSSIFWGRLERKWQEIRQIIQDNSLTEDIKLKKEKFECYVLGDSLNIRDLEYNLKHKKIGLKFAFAPPKSKKEREKLFGVFLRAGTPIAIWLKENQIQGINLETETDNWIKRKYLADLNLLLADIRREREKAYFKKSLVGDYLVIFCDDPTIRPTKPLSMSTSQPLSLT